MDIRLGIILSIFAVFSIPATFAQDASSEILVIQETMIPMHIAHDNALPWGFVEGKIANPAENYPVIIQIYKQSEPIHFAQATVGDDGTYEYKFRVLDVTGGKTTRVFEGDYTVKIFKVVELDSSLLDYLKGEKNSGKFDIGIDVLGNYNL